MLPAILFSGDTPTPFESSNGKRSATYQEIISWYEYLDRDHKEISLKTFDSTDIGLPLHLVVISGNGNFEPENWKKDGKVVLLINNGIHPGEPEGIDASMMLARDLVSKEALKKLLEKVVICIVPVYNVDGCLNRGRYSRANQDGPESYGFRGNYQNLDLNRDFIKCDSRNARSFTKLFHWCAPHVFIDTHTSNGADYQYTMTYIATQKDKLPKLQSSYMTDFFLPALEKSLLAKKHKISPYVNTVKEIPDSGIIGFMDSPRYSSGYAALFDCISIITETHMLKPFDKRVEATYDYLLAAISIMSEQKESLLNALSYRLREGLLNGEYVLNWKHDPSTWTMINFDGYEARQKKSGVSGEDRLYYDRNKPFSKEIPYYHKYIPGKRVAIPDLYIIPQCWEKVIELLTLNGVEMQRLTQNVDLKPETYYIRDYKTTARPYEGHYLHYDVEVDTLQQLRKFYKGDYVVNPYQKNLSYIMETLEPQATDSYFAWNFFDAALGQKEHFSNYVFEDLAEKLLKEDAALKEKFERNKKEDKKFAEDGNAQLDFIYRHSPYYEKSHMRYPVGRIFREYVPVR